MSSKLELPTNAELEILTVLWQKGASTAREVHDIIVLNKKTGYTTTLKTIQNMYEKQMLSREPKGQTHLYSPSVAQEQIQQKMLGGFVNKVFGGSSKQMILQALGNDDASAEELEEIRKMLDELKAKKS